MAELRDAWRHLNRVPELWRAALAFERPLDVARQYLRQRPLDTARGLMLRGSGMIQLEAYEDLVTAWVIFCRREYRVPPFARHIVDLGANIGCFTLFALRQSPKARVVAFEPMPPTFARLQQTLRWNGIAQTVMARPVGVAAQGGRRIIPASAAPSQSLGMVGVGQDAGSGATDIDVLSFDELVEQSCEALESSRLDLLKMDVEGAEHEALAAASDQALRRIGALAMEYHPNGDRGVLFRRLMASGFTVEHDRRIGPAAGVAHFRR